ncbi:MAG TPA: phosphate ABC transporter substrate-binding protein PstS [Dehalococcoidia bacterium]|nr:phosphate ABC transporter substrate-binding protein PstS [Dehalococcoidia bacterium]
MNMVTGPGSLILASFLVVLFTANACAPQAPEAPASSAARPTATAPQPTPTPGPVTAAGSGIVSSKFAGEAQALNGAGATFPAVLYSKWFNEYEKVTGVKVNYQSIGSGGGIKSISDATVDFGATDGPMTDDQLRAARNGDILHIPAAMGAVVPTYNLPELGSTSLKFSPESLAGIFLGQITKWNDPKIAADNPGVTLPNKDIVVVHRSDGSGTTYIWVDYLSAVSKEWKDKVGVATSVNWPVGLGGKGNEGVAGEVKQNPYAIGYVELIYATQNKLGVGFVKNKAGKYVAPSLESVTAAAAGAAKNIVPDLRASIVNADGDTSYPVSGFTWLLIYKNQTDKAKAQALTRMAWWATHDAQKYNTDLGYAPLPDDIVKKAEEKILSVTADGQKAFPHDVTKKP